MLSRFFQNQCLTLGTLPSNNIPNPKGKMKAITTRSGVAYDGPLIPTPKKVVEQETEETTDKEQSNFQGSTARILSLVTLILEPGVPKTLPKPNISYPSRLNDQKLREKATNQMDNSSKYFRICTLTLGSDFNLEEIDAYLKDESISPEIDHADCDPEGDICLIEKLLNDDPFQLLPMDLKQGEVVKEKSSIEEPLELELKELPSHLEYAYLEDVDKLPVIISKDLKVDEKESILKVLKSHKKAIAWKITDIKGIDPRFCTHKILMEEDYKPVVQSQRRVTQKFMRSFLGHAGFYRRFIQEFSKIARPMTHLLEKETPFVFSKDCIDAFETLKKKLTEAPIIVVPDWNLPFELMCDASDFVIGVVLGQLYAFERFRPYLVFSKSIVYTDHSALKYLLSKQDAKSSDRGTHFRNDKFAKVMSKYEVTHRLSTAYHPQTSGQVEVSNQGLKCILERTVGENRTLWSEKSDVALWAFKTAYKTPIGCTPYKLVYGKFCHLPIELEHKAYWALKHVNFDLKTTGDYQKLQLNELNELRDQAYKNSLIYKEKTKKIHDSKIKNRIFNVGDWILLFNSRLKIFSGKLKTRWSGPFTITKVFPYGTIELSQPDGPNFKVNGHRVKHYFGGDVPQLVVLDLQTFPMEK
nr:reverse transcriptase domain-containing protein [Tanacetum cinerariifolium]